MSDPTSFVAARYPSAIGTTATGHPRLVTLLEYGDTRCPDCSRCIRCWTCRNTSGSAPAFVFRHFPVASVHPQAELATEAAEAAGPGAVWEMHGMLFVNQFRDAGDILEYGRRISLDPDRLRERSGNASLL